MSLLIDKQSAESIRYESDLFKVPPTQTSLEDVFFLPNIALYQF